MKPSKRHAIWGYRTKPTDLYIEMLEARIQERRLVRDAAMSQLKSRLNEAEAAVTQSQVAIQSLQSDYFRLSSELNAMASRAQQLLEEAEARWQVEEDRARAKVQDREKYRDTLSKIIREVPDDLQKVIEKISRTIIHENNERHDWSPAGDRNQPVRPADNLSTSGPAHG